jgi:hypothetical protein
MVVGSEIDLFVSTKYLSHTLHDCADISPLTGLHGEEIIIAQMHSQWWLLSND